MKQGDARGHGRKWQCNAVTSTRLERLASEEPAHGTRLASTQIRPHALSESDAESQTQRRSLARMGWRS